ncbi:MAG: nucleotide exchange factor GrpE [Propionibacteriaceae bacterium]|jgi:molecular chaperone GrpE|nr:nucleotide exchange factor GrpE [Propionibacteriaceae bacterium]
MADTQDHNWDEDLENLVTGLGASDQEVPKDSPELNEIPDGCCGEAETSSSCCGGHGNSSIKDKGSSCCGGSSPCEDSSPTSCDPSPSSCAQSQNPETEKTVEELLEERTTDLQRLQAEYVNYKRRVDRDRDQARQRGIEAVLVDLLPMLDGIDAAKAHDELTGGAAMLSEEVSKVASKYGLESFGEEGDEFDPHVHEALMRIDKPGYPVESVAQIFQRGYKIGERVVRPARVGVADADESATPVAPGETAGEAV